MMAGLYLHIAILALVLANFSCHAFQAPLNRLQYRSIYQTKGGGCSSLMQRPPSLSVDLHETPQWLTFRKQAQRIGDISRQIIRSPVAKTIVLPIVFQVILVSVFHVNPVLAAAVSVGSSSTQRSKALKASSRAAAVAGLPKWYRVLRKIFLGASGKSVKSLKTGETRFDGSSTTTFISSMLLIVVGVFFASFLVRWEEDSEFKRMKKEVARENEYRENMVFDAVDAILRRLKDPNIKPALKKELLEQLKDLDPKGEIQLFLAGKGPRPDVGTQLQANIKRKQKMREQRQKQQEQQQQQQQQQEQAKSSSNAPSSSTKGNGGNNNNKPPNKGVRGRSEVSASGDRRGKNKAQKRDEDDEEEEDEDEHEDDDEDDEYVESDDEEEDDEEDDLPDRNTSSSNKRISNQSQRSNNNNNNNNNKKPTSTAPGTASSVPSTLSPAARQVLIDLDTSLRTGSSSSALSESQRRRLTQDLATALGAIQNAEKLQVAIQRIRNRIGDVEYWRDYLEE